MPRSKKTFKKEYCEGLVEHMSKGHSFRSYGAKIKAGISTLERWVRENKKFREAKELGEAHSLLFYETERNLASLGQLQKVKKEKIVRTTFLDKNGSQVPEEKAEIKEQVLEREYADSPFKETSWIFIMKSRFHYTDFVMAPPGGKVDPDHTPRVIELAYRPDDKPFTIVDNEVPSAESKQG